MAAGLAPVLAAAVAAGPVAEVVLFHRSLLGCSSAQACLSDHAAGDRACQRSLCMPVREGAPAQGVGTLAAVGCIFLASRVAVGPAAAGKACPGLLHHTLAVHDHPAYPWGEADVVAVPMPILQPGLEA